jgi:hypothetical protein
MYSGRLIPAIDTIAASLFPQSEDWLSAIMGPGGYGEAAFFLFSAVETSFNDLNFQKNSCR